MSELKSETFEGLEGYWLRSAVAEAFVTCRPFPRVAAFRRIGGQSPLWITTANQFFGVRTWYMEPVQLAEAPLPALQAGQARATGERSLRVTAGEEPTTGLQVVMEVSLEADKAALVIRHGLKNLREKTRRLAGWAINVVPHRGVAVTPLARDPNIFRSYILFTGMDGSDPSLRVGKDAVGIDYRMPAAGGWTKTGTNTDAGFVAYAWDGGALVSRAWRTKWARSIPRAAGQSPCISRARRSMRAFARSRTSGRSKMSEAAERCGWSSGWSCCRMCGSKAAARMDGWRRWRRADRRAKGEGRGAKRRRTEDEEKRTFNVQHSTFNVQHRT